MHCRALQAQPQAAASSIPAAWPAVDARHRRHHCRRHPSSAAAAASQAPAAAAAPLPAVARPKNQWLVAIVEALFSIKPLFALASANVRELRPSASPCESKRCTAALTVSSCAACRLAR